MAFNFSGNGMGPTFKQELVTELNRLGNGLIESGKAGKRTTLGEFGFVTSRLPININTVDRKIEFPNTDEIYATYRNINQPIGPTIKNTSISAPSDGFVFFDTVNFIIKAGTALPSDGENYIILGYIFWSTKTFKLNMNLSIDGQVTPTLGEFGFITSDQPININTANKTLEFPNTDSLFATYRGINMPLSSYKNTTLDISFGGFDGGFVYFNTNTFQMKATPALPTDHESYIILGYIFLWSNTFQLNMNYTVDGRNHDSVVNKKWNGKAINCLGDSITWGDNGLDGGGNEISWVAHLPELNGFSVARNYGERGTTITKRNDRTDSFLERYPSMNNNAQVITIFGGINDHIQHCVLGTSDSTDVYTFYGALKSLISGMITKYPTAVITFFTPMKCDKYTNSFQPNNQGHTLIEYRNAILEVCDYYSVPVLDMYSQSGISPFSPEHVANFMPDKLHYSPAGYTRLANKISSYLETL